MMFLVLDKNPGLAAQKVPNKLKFKQLLELAQMISTIVDGPYKPVRQGKKIMNWIVQNKKNKCFTLNYFAALYNWCFKNIKMQNKTKQDMSLIYVLLCNYNYEFKMFDKVPVFENIKTAIFRFSKDYANTKFESNSELDISTCVNEYKKYLSWKGYEV